MENRGTVTDKYGIAEAVPWGHISGYSWGNSLGVKVLALHGWLDNSGTFFKLLPLLSQNINMVAIDLPGHGKSSHRPPGSNNHFQEYIMDVQLVLEALKWRQFVILGHSLGAAVALWYAGIFPERVLRIILIDTIGQDTASADNIIDHLSANLANLKESVSMVYPTFDAVAKKLWSSYSIKDPTFTLEAAQTLCERGVVSVQSGYQFSADNRHKRAHLLRLEDGTGIAYVKKTSCPILIFLFKQSFVTMKKIKHIISVIPKDQIKVVEVDGGHHTHLCSPETVAPSINLFLSQYSKL